MTEEALKARLSQIATDFAYELIRAVADYRFDDLGTEFEVAAMAPDREDDDEEVEEIEPEPAVVEEPASEIEASILEHLNEAGPTGSTVRAWVISTQGELPESEHAEFEAAAIAVLEALETRGTIQKGNFSRSRGQVYSLAPS